MKKSLFVFAICAFFLTSCGKSIVGNWNVDRYEVDNLKGQNYTARNAGEIRINKGGTGEMDLQYNMFQSNVTDVRNFRWNRPNEDLMTITSTDSYEQSDFDKTWIIVTDKKKKQVWKSTDGSNTVQTLELTKK